MVSKLHINAAQGIIDVEGETEFVEKVYEDFKGQIEIMLNSAPSHQQFEDAGDDAVEEKVEKKAKKASTKRTKKKTEASKQTVPAYKPKLDSSTPLTGLDTFYNGYKPKNNSERVLLFCKYLQNNGLGSCTADQIYTCFVKCDSKNLPKAFPQSLIDARGKDRGYIEYDKLENISVSAIGEHHLLTSMADE